MRYICLLAIYDIVVFYIGYILVNYINLFYVFKKDANNLQIKK